MDIVYQAFVYISRSNRKMLRKFYLIFVFLYNKKREYHRMLPLVADGFSLFNFPNNSNSIGSLDIIWFYVHIYYRFLFHIHHRLGACYDIGFKSYFSPGIINCLNLLELYVSRFGKHICLFSGI